MAKTVLETIWRRPEGIWVKPSQLAESMGVDTAHVHDLARRGLLQRRPTDGAVFVEGSDTPRFKPGAVGAEAQVIASVAEMLAGVRASLNAVHAQIDEAVQTEVQRVYAETLREPAPAAKPQQQSSWFAFPFGISL